MKKKYVFRTSAATLSAFLAAAAAQASFASVPASAQESSFPTTFDLRNVDTNGGLESPGELSFHAGFHNYRIAFAAITGCY